MTPKPTISPAPLYIADPGERLINMMVEEALKWLIEEVEQETIINNPNGQEK